MAGSACTSRLEAGGEAKVEQLAVHYGSMIIRTSRYSSQLFLECVWQGSLVRLVRHTGLAWRLRDDANKKRRHSTPIPYMARWLETLLGREGRPG